MLSWPAALSGRGLLRRSAEGSSAQRADQELRQARGVVPLQDLSALTPPLLICAVVLIAIVAFLRHELGKKRPDESESAHDIPPRPPISDHRADDQVTGASSADSAGDR
jgi:hypothetical protein